MFAMRAGTYRIVECCAECGKGSVNYQNLCVECGHIGTPDRWVVKSVCTPGKHWWNADKWTLEKVRKTY